MGVFLRRKSARHTKGSLPHACGGVSKSVFVVVSGFGSSPRVWGCFSRLRRLSSHAAVFPTRVGVFLYRIGVTSFLSGLPHACGGVSGAPRSSCPAGPSSPRVWGCFYGSERPKRPGNVFPTRVGVFPRARPCAPSGYRLPHACGGVSLWRLGGCARDKSSPRVWGCFWAVTSCILIWWVFPTRVGVFHTISGTSRDWTVFPTRVGVFLHELVPSAPFLRLPHACGGVSSSKSWSHTMSRSSPRVWGCFRVRGSWFRVLSVFPTRVGVFLLFPRLADQIGSLPHACGGVSKIPSQLGSPLLSSPRVWGCFRGEVRLREGRIVFPTRVGVFPRRLVPHPMGSRLPHACGGVSQRLSPHSQKSESSPRVWGCFYPRLDRFVLPGVFPTRVGVFLYSHTQSPVRRSLPHACGGVSKHLFAGFLRYLSSPRVWGCF